MSHDLAPTERVPIPLRPIETDAGRLASAPFGNIPRALTSFLGRDADIAAVRILLVERHARLITLTGPGGVGKTRLAVRIAEDVASAFPDGIAFVPLAPITAPDLVLSEIARVFGLHERAGLTVASLLVRHLRHRQVLLILDNVEQVVGAAPFIAVLLGDCPALTLLATSRSRLHISGEHRFPVSPLALPVARPVDGGGSLATVAASPAVQLFVERAQAVDPSFALTENNAEAVAAICRRLDGVPLAIELAAVRMQLLTPEELLAHLAPALPLLSDGPQDVPHRLRTMRNAIAWSYELLMPVEQALLRRLSVFAGGCTLEAAEAVVGDGRSRTPAVQSAETPSFLETIAALVDASLVRRDDTGGETRLTMLETIREFAVEQLAASGEMEEIATRHAAWCVQLAETIRRSGALSRQEGLVRLESEYPNMRAALDTLLTRGDVTTALQLGGELAEFWFRRGHLVEGRARLERALTDYWGGPTAARANALVGLNMLLWPQAAHTNVQANTDPPGEEPDGFARSVRLLDEAEAVARAAGDAGALAYARLHQGYVALLRGDLGLAEARGAEGIVTAAAIPQGFSLNAAYWLLAEVALSRGDDGQATEHFTRLLKLARAGGDEISLANALGGLATLAERRGEPGAALRGFADAAAVGHDSGDLLHAGFRLEQGATTAAAIGHTSGAVRLLAAADAVRVVEGMGAVRLGVRQRHHHEQTLQTAHATLGNDLFAKLWTAGSALALDEAIAELYTLAAQVSAAAPADLAGQPTALTARERDVLRLLADGLGDKAIATTLGISRRTASQHVAAILGKLGAESRTAAVAIALREGLLASSLLNYA